MVFTIPIVVEITPQKMFTASWRLSMSDALSLLSAYIPDRYFQHETPESLSRFGEELELSTSTITGTRTLIMRADTIRITSDIRAPGLTLFLHCRVLEISGPTPLTLNVSGAEPPGQAAKPATPTQPGGHGTPGNPGVRGDHAGNIFLYATHVRGPGINLIADGGRGQQGQAGGDAARGAAGMNARAGRAGKNDRGNAGSPGTPGGKGGDAGQGAVGGQGGDAGSLVVMVPKATHEKFKLQATEGKGGSGGNSGKRGEGGPPGAAAARFKKVSERRFTGRDVMSWSEWVEDGMHPSMGSHGPGADKDHGVVGQDGTKSKRSELLAVQVSELRRSAVLPSLQLHVEYAHRAYLNKDLTKAKELCLWLFDILSETSNLGVDVHEHDPAKAPGTKDDDAARALLFRTMEMLDHLNRGLSVFGDRPDYVPLLSYTFLLEYATRALDTLETLEASHASYLKALENSTWDGWDADAHIRGLEASMDEVKSRARELEREIQDVDDNLEKLFDELDRRAVELHDQLLEMQEAIITYNQGKGGKCEDLQQLIKIGRLVVGVAGGIDVAGTELTASYKLYKEYDKVRATLGQVERIEKLAKIVGKAGKGVDGILDAGSSIIELFTPEERDNVLLVSRLEDLEDIYKEYAGLPAVERHKELIEEFQVVTQARNKLVLGRDALASQHNALWIQHNLQTSELAQTRDRWAREYQPNQLRDISGLALGVHRQRLECQWSLDMLHRVLGFWTLREEPFLLENPTATGVKMELARLERVIAREHARRRSPEQRFESMRPLQWTDSSKEGQRTLSHLREHGTVSVNIGSHNAPYLRGWAITVDEIRVELSGAQVLDDILYLVLIHHGDGGVRDGRGLWRDVEFLPRRVGFEYNVSTGKIGRPGKLVEKVTGPAAVTPYGTWTLEIPSHNNPELDLANIDALRIWFKGYSRA